MNAHLERNSKKLVEVLVRCGLGGALSTDLRRCYEDQTTLRGASFYAALAHAKKKQWVIGGGFNQPYTLNSNGIWNEALRLPSVAAGSEKAQLEWVIDLQAAQIDRLETTNRRLIGAKKVVAAGAAGGPAVAALTAIMSDSSVTTRRRLQAAEALLAYRTPQDVSESARLFLASVCADSSEQNIDFRLAAATALRRSEGDPRIMPQILRPDPAPVADIDPVKEAEERRLEHERKVAHLERQLILDREQMERERQQMTSSHRLPVAD